MHGVIFNFVCQHNYKSWMYVKLKACNFNRHRNAYKAFIASLAFTGCNWEIALQYRLDIATKESFQCPKHDGAK